MAPYIDQCKFPFQVRPVETRLIASELGAMTADVEYEVRCETAGAQPAAVISWWINGNIRLKDFINEVSDEDRWALDELVETSLQCGYGGCHTRITGRMGCTSQLSPLFCFLCYIHHSHSVLE